MATMTENTVSVFISYSRKDAHFVKKIDEALRKRHIDVKVDWEFKTGEDWRKQIENDITVSDYFVFVVSSNSFMSEHCHRELRTARRLRKKIFPIILTKIDEDGLRQYWHTQPWSKEAEVELNLRQCQGIQWIEVADIDYLDAAINELAEGFRFSLEIARKHTDYLLQSQTWDEKGRHTDYLLKSERVVKEAEDWLSETQDKEPAPIQLHVEFIQASRDHRNKTQRRVWLFSMVGMSVASLILAVLVVALIVTQNQRETALRNFEQARSQVWANNALQALSSGQTDLALFLALESINTDPVPSQAYQVLIEGFYAPGVSRRYNGPFEQHQGRINSAAINATGTRVALADLEGELILWDLQEDTALIQFPPVDNSTVQSLAFSSDGQQIAAGYDSGVMLVWDSQSGDILFEDRQMHNSAITALEFHHTGDYLVSGDNSGTIIIWDLRTKTVAHAVSIHTGSINDIDFSPNGENFVSASNDATLAHWDLATGGLIHRFTGHNGWVTTVQWVDDESIISGAEDNTLFLWDADAQIQTPRRYFVGHQDTITSLDVDSTGQYAISVSRDRMIFVWDLKTATAIWRLDGAKGGHESAIIKVGFASDNKTAVTVSTDRHVTQWFVGDRSNLKHLDNTHGRFVSNLAVLSNGDDYMLSHATDEVWLRRASDGEIIQEFNSEERTFQASLSPDGRFVITGTRNGGVYLWDASPTSANFGSLLFKMGGEEPVQTAIITSLMFNADSSLALSSSDDGSVVIWDVETGEVLAHFVGHTDKVIEAAFVPGSALVVSVDTTGEVIVWNLDEKREVRRFSGNQVDSLFTGIAVSSDGQLIAIASSGENNNRIMLWTIAGEPAGQLVGHTDLIWDLAFNDNGYLVSSSDNGTVILWDITRQQMLYPYQVNNVGVRSVAFANYGEEQVPIIVAGGMDGEVSLWYVPDLAEVVETLTASTDKSRINICDDYTLYDLPSCNQ